MARARTGAAGGAARADDSGAACVKPGLVIARSQRVRPEAGPTTGSATKQSSSFLAALDCFASLAMTRFGISFNLIAPLRRLDLHAANPAIGKAVGVVDDLVGHDRTGTVPDDLVHAH